MPNYGRSGRCVTCERRRVKCDEAKPACSQCRRLQLDCGGYAKSYTFRNENHKFSSSTAAVKTRQQRSLGERVVRDTPSQSRLTVADVAVPFFLVQYSAMGRRLPAARGFYETLIMVYAAQRDDSVLSLAVSATAERVFALWTGEDREDPARARHSMHYGQAIRALGKALREPKERNRAATILAVLALHLYENISVVYDGRQATPIHHEGALSLLQRPTAASSSGNLEDLVGTYVRGFVLHTEIASALRQKRLLHRNALSYVGGQIYLHSIPGNLSSTLDYIGVSVAQLQAGYMRHASGPASMHQCNYRIAEAARIGELLNGWEQSVPESWRPRRLLSRRDFSDSLLTYQGGCDVYPSCQVATLWNLWRCHRLLLLKIALEARQQILTLQAEAPEGLDVPSPNKEDAARSGDVQEIVDGICYSVPFYLGNRTEASGLQDFGDMEILFPSHHWLAEGDAWRQQGSHDIALSEDEHRRHMLAYGAWHIISPLSNLLELFDDSLDGRLVASSLRPGQREWVRTQFLRVATLVRLRGQSSANTQAPVETEAEDLARRIRGRAVFMSGP